MVRLITSLLVLGHAYMAMSQSDDYSVTDDSVESETPKKHYKHHKHHRSSAEEVTDASPQEDGALVDNSVPPLPEGAGKSYSIEDMLGAKGAPAPAPATDPADSMLDSGSDEDSDEDSSGDGDGDSDEYSDKDSNEDSETSEDPMAALLRGDVGTVGSDEEAEDDEDEGFSMKHVDLGESSKQIVEGLVDSFMHKVNLEPGEKQCLADSLGSFVGDITSIGRDAINAFKGFMKPDGHGMQASSAGVAGLMPLAMDGITRITDLVSVSTSLVKRCVQGDALDMLNQTAHNLVNFTYLEKRLIVNGVNIAEAIAQSIIDFEKHQFYDFGSQIGLALRKICLSTATNGIKLPEGMPEDEIIADASEGIVNGFFAPGVHFVVNDKADSNVHIDIDLHACIAGNHLFYREIWESLWTLFAQLAVNKGQHDGSDGSAPVWENELLMAVMRLPMAFTKCGVDAEMESMMIEAFKTFKALSVTFTFPDDKIKADSATEKVALAVEYFTKWKFFKFGQELGKLFRELLLLALPKKYSVDHEGRLRRNLLGEAEVFKASNLLHVSNEGRTTIVMGSLAMVLLMSLVAVRRLRLPWQQANAAHLDVEAGGDQELELLE